MEDVYYLPPGACEDFYFATNPFDKDYIRGVDELRLEILYGDRIRKTIERLNYEWLKKMWKVSEDDLMVFMFEQIAKKFDSSLERQLSSRERIEAIRRTRYTAF